MTRSDVTVVVATFDRPSWLEMAVRSIQASAAHAARHGIDTRIVVVDDASPTNAAWSVCQRSGVEYERVAERSGRHDPATARGLGLSKVNSELFCFFDDDDVMLEEHIVRHVGALADGADVAISSYWFTDEELRPYRRYVPMQPTLGMLLAGHNPVNDYALQRTASCASAWHPELGELAPLGAWLELAYRGARFVRVVTPTFLYRHHEANMSEARDDRFARERAALEARYRQKVLARDGTVPRPPFAFIAREAIAKPARAVLRARRRVS